MPKVSVIIPTYNSAQYIVGAIDSALNQTFQDFELIIVNDGSTDDTKEVVADCINKHPDKIKYFYQENKGPGAARNKGIQESRGQYIAFLDADDILLENSLLLRVGFFDKHPLVALVFTDYYLKEHKDTQIDDAPVLKKRNFLEAFSGSINFSGKDEFIFNNGFYYRYLSFRPYPVWMGAAAIRKDIIKDTGLFRTDINVSEDSDFWLRIAEKCKVGFINQPTAIYNRFTTNSLSKTTEVRYLDTLKQLFSIYEDPHNTLPKGILKEKIANAFSSLAYYYFSIYNIKSARKYFLLSIKYRPFQVKSFIYLNLCLLPVGVIRYLRNVKNFGGNINSVIDNE